MGDQSAPQTPDVHQPISLDAIAKYINLGRAVIAKYPVLAVVASSVITNYAPLVKPYVVALGKLVGLTCQ